MESGIEPFLDPVRPPARAAASPPRPPVPGTPLVARELADVEARLATLAQGATAPLPAIAAHLVGGGGKRVRPLILLLAARAHGLTGHDVQPLACAAELLHSATLLHDDVVDEADKRRGRVVANQRWGNALAVLAGDFCLARALTELTRAGRIEAVATLAATVQEMAEGEVIQLRQRGRVDLRERTYYAVLNRKTASLIAWCARVGGLLPRASDGTMERYGRAMGIAFQIADDILDYQGDATITGKSLGTDLREGKATLPLIEACHRLPDLRVEIQGRVERDEWDDATLARLVIRVRDCGAVEAARRAARGAAAEARDAAESLPASPYRQALSELAVFCADRVA